MTARPDLSRQHAGSPEADPPRTGVRIHYQPQVNVSHELCRDYVELTPVTVLEVLQQCRLDLAALPTGGMPGLVERLARSRLDMLTAARRSDQASSSPRLPATVVSMHAHQKARR